MIEIFRLKILKIKIMKITENKIYNGDIAIAIVSKNFVGTPFYDVQKISKYRRSVD